MLREHFRMRGYGGGVFFFERDRTAPRPGQIYVQADLLHRWALGRDTVPPFLAGQSKGISSVRAHLDDVRLSLILDSDTLPSASWKITPGHRAKLAFSMTRLEWSGWEAGDLTVSVDQQVVATQTVPERDIMEFWRPVQVDLSPWSGKAITLSLQVHAKRPGGTIGIPVADPIVYASELDDLRVAGKPD